MNTRELKTIVIAVINNKGGVGKTTTAVQLAYGLAQLKKKKTLLLDLDAQMNASQLMQLPTDAWTVWDLLHCKEGMPTEVCKNLDAIAGDINMSNFEQEVFGGIFSKRLIKTPQSAVRTMVDHFRGDYDFIILDTAPAMGNTMLNYLYAADYALIPAQPEMLPIFGISNIVKLIENVRSIANKQVQFLGVLFIAYESRRAVHNNINEVMRKEYGDKIFKTMVRKCSALTEAIGESIYTYAPKSNAAEDYTNAINEILKRIKTFETTAIDATI